LFGVICLSCIAITGRKKILVPKVDNLEKHEGKWTCWKEGVPFAYLKKGETFLKFNYKHAKNTKLWAAKKHANTIAD